MAFANAPVPQWVTPSASVPSGNIRVHNCLPHQCLNTRRVVPELVVFLDKPKFLRCHFVRNQTKACLGADHCPACQWAAATGRPPTSDSVREMAYLPVLLHQPFDLTEEGKLVWERVVYMLSADAGKRVRNQGAGSAFHFHRKRSGSVSYYESASLGRVTWLAANQAFDPLPIVLAVQYPDHTGYRAMAAKVSADLTGRCPAVTPPKLFAMQHEIVSEPYREHFTRTKPAPVPLDRPAPDQAAANAATLKGYAAKLAADVPADVPPPARPKAVDWPPKNPDHPARKAAEAAKQKAAEGYGQSHGRKVADDLAARIGTAADLPPVRRAEGGAA